MNKWITVKEAVELHGRTENYYRKAINQNRIKSHGRNPKYTTSAEVERLIEEELNESQITDRELKW